MVNVDELYMQLALDEAWKYQGLTYPNPAVGAVVAIEGRPLSIAAHQYAGGPHAEVLALKMAYYALTQDEKILPLDDAFALHSYLIKHASSLFYKATLYVTLEPCNHTGKTPACAGLIEKLGIQRVVIGTPDPNPKASGGIARLKNAKRDVVVGVLEEKAKFLIEPFERWSNKRFIFFKFAQTLNGNITDGTISSQKAREYVHSLRDKIELLVIGGNTVRTDRPTLDSRLVGGTAPDVLIYSHYKELDRAIPLFSVKKRRVFIDNTLEKIDKYRYIMIEGGEGMLRVCRELVDWYLIFVAPYSNEMDNYKAPLSMRFMYQKEIGKDLMVWSKNG